MASNRLLASTPLTFELPSSLVDRIHDCRGRLGLKSASDVVRRALADFDFAGFQAPADEQSQISVRLTPDQKRILFKTARQKKVSAGELLRAALEALSDGATAAGRNGDGKTGLRPSSGKTGKKLAAKAAGKNAAARKK
jgi:Arc/MetJ-type ribon-helix-helix transcriptional regulator